MKESGQLIARILPSQLLIASAMLLSLEGLGQGTVNFSNIGLAAPVRYPCDNLAPLASAGTTFSVALYFAPYDINSPNTQPDPSTFTQIGPSAHLLLPGIYADGMRSAPVSPPGSLGWFEVKAWLAAYGSTYEQAQANENALHYGLTAVSNIIRVHTGDPTSGGSPASLLGISGVNFFVDPPLPCVPEPPAAMLGFLAAMVLLASSRDTRSG
jgi:hypothetical protein